MEQADKIFPIFFGVWIVLGIFSIAFLFLNNNANLKRKVWPPFVIFVGALFLGFVWLMGLPAQALYILIPPVILVTYMNLRAYKFCQSCGKTLMNFNPFSDSKICSNCGAKLK